MKQRIQQLNWADITDTMHTKGYAQVKALLSNHEVNSLKALYPDSGLYRKTDTMERHLFGLGEYKYFDYPLLGLLQSIREGIYPYLAVIATQWMQALNIPTRYPDSLKELHQLCREQNQVKPTVLILNYGPGGFNTLHQDLYGDVYFPIQMALFLSEPEADYTGGEFVLTEQIPRAQSKAHVLRPAKGDALIFTTNFRPARGHKGYYRATMKHGVSEVHTGNRCTLGIIFHDALN